MGGGILTRNAFTLIELLAIIVILAIIAVITVPIILNIIDNSKRGAAKDSAYGYKDSINKWYVSKLSEDPNYNITDGEYKVGQLGEQVEGKVPGDNSWFVVSKNEVTDACLQFDEYKVEITDGKVGDAVKGECSSNNNSTSAYEPLTGEVLENIASYDTMEIIYYNPISGTMNCTDYDSDNSTPGYKGVVPSNNTLGQTSCLKWYKYSTNTDGSINMILDHNTEVGTKYNTSQNNTYGPSNLMQYLTLADWAGVPTRSDKYIAYKLNADSSKTVLFTNATSNAVNYSGKKARLITAQEIAEITGAASATSPGISWDEQNTSSSYFYLDSKSRDFSTHRTADNPSTYYWLFENLYNCTSYGCSPTGDNAHTQPGNTVQTGNYGYSTSSPSAGSSNFAWYVDDYGDLGSFYVNYTDLGVRPVITVSNS